MDNTRSMACLCICFSDGARLRCFWCSTVPKPNRPEASYLGIVPLGKGKGKWKGVVEIPPLGISAIGIPAVGVEQKDLACDPTPGYPKGSI